ncbi:MAG: carbamoyltransferase HypF [bacterium]
MKSAKSRLRIEVKGTVQGVGFRPFVYRLADKFSLNGWVNNSAAGLFIEVEGPDEKLDKFKELLVEQKPAPAIINNIKTEKFPAAGYRGFKIKKSSEAGEKKTDILPDLATCPDCLDDITDPGNRRYRYPFTNCTNCGPRYSIIKDLPYDRPYTSMAEFKMCPRCREEYENPLDRRFHAQPNACPECGPRLQWFDAGGGPHAEREEALEIAEKYIRQGKTIALKGLGGFQLLADARNYEAVDRLRMRKKREAKPFALMYPGLKQVKKEFKITDKEEQFLISPAAPIVLLEERKSSVADNIAFDNPFLGVMLPYTPLHHILMDDLGFPVIATSGNISGEPICIKNDEAVDRLADIADGFLVHDRKIVRPVDDSVVCVSAGQPQVIRRARGYAPAPFEIRKSNKTVLALGGQLKNTVSLLSGRRLISSQYLGDLDSPASRNLYNDTVSELLELYDEQPDIIATDLHPDYYSTQFSNSLSAKKIKIHHHHAHVAACMLDNDLTGEVLGVSWDGTGLGADRTIWGGEFLRADRSSYDRFACFKPFRLPGGEKAVMEPRRSALGVLLEISGSKDPADIFPEIKEMFNPQELKLTGRAAKQKLNSPLTSSAGRLFDAVSALLNICQKSSYLGEGPCRLEYAAYRSRASGSYSFSLTPGEKTKIVDWSPLIKDIIKDRRRGEAVEDIARKFHNTLAEIIATVAVESGLEKIVLTGGCFQNRLVTRLAVEALRKRDLKPYWHKNIPPGDGGISVGQAVIASGQFK